MLETTKEKGGKNTHTHTVYRIEREKETVLRVASWPISACYSDVTMATVRFFSLHRVGVTGETISEIGAHTHRRWWCCNKDAIVSIRVEREFS